MERRSYHQIRNQELFVLAKERKAVEDQGVFETKFQLVPMQMIHYRPSGRVVPY
jgi:hypothetical protein